MGFGGVGKTQLVNVVGRDEAVRYRFDGGVLSARAGPGARPPHYYLKQWLAHLGCTIITECSTAHLHHRIRSEFRDRQPLVIIDGALWASELAPLRLPGVQARYLVISRQRDLRFKLEKRACEAIVVEALDRAAGRRLFKALLPREPELFKVPSRWLDEAADDCQGLPLAIELAAKAVVRLGWVGFRAGMGSTQTRLATLSLPRPEEPHHSLLLTLFTSYQALPSELRVRLAALRRIIASDFSGSPYISTTRAGHAWGTDQATTKEVLEQLADGSWLRCTPDGNYAFQSFVLELLTVLDSSTAWEDTLRRYLAVMNRLQESRPGD